MYRQTHEGSSWSAGSASREWGHGLPTGFEIDRCDAIATETAGKVRCSGCDGVFQPPRIKSPVTERHRPANRCAHRAALASTREGSGSTSLESAKYHREDLNLSQQASQPCVPSLERWRNAHAWCARRREQTVGLEPTTGRLTITISLRPETGREKCRTANSNALPLSYVCSCHREDLNLSQQASESCVPSLERWRRCPEIDERSSEQPIGVEPMPPGPCDNHLATARDGRR